MRGNKIILIGIILIFVYSIFPTPFSSASENINSYILTSPVNVKIRFMDSVTNKGPNSISLTTYFAVPPSLPNQFINGSIIFEPNNFHFITDNWGQSIAYYRRNVGIGTTSSTSWTIEAKLYNIKYFINPRKAEGEVPDEILLPYTADAEMYQINNPAIQEAVKEAIGDEKNPYWKALKLHDYVIDHLYYKNDHRWDDAPTVLKQGHGSCTEYCWLYIALCRAAGIPSRYVGGTHIRDTPPYTDTTFHRWVQIYLPNYGWIPVDPTWDDLSKNRHRYFGATSNTLFATTISGGPSTYLKWNYNCYDSWSPKSNVDIERKAIWLKYEKNTGYCFHYSVHEQFLCRIWKHILYHLFNERYRNFLLLWNSDENDVALYAK